MNKYSFSGLFSSDLTILHTFKRKQTHNKTPIPEMRSKGGKIWGRGAWKENSMNKAEGEIRCEGITQKGSGEISEILVYTH